MANNIDDVILRSWGNISGILGPGIIEVIKKNRVTLSKTLSKAKKFPGFFCSAEIFIITTKWKPLLSQEKNGTNYLANNVLILIYSHLDITTDHNINM